MGGLLSLGLGLVAVGNAVIAVSLVLRHCLVSCLCPFLVGQFHDVVDYDLGVVDGFANLDVVFLVVVDCHRVDFGIGEAVALALHHFVEDVGRAVVDVLLRLAECLGEDFVLCCHALQIVADGLLEMFCCLHVDDV